MAKAQSLISQLTKLIKQLQSERQEHVNKIEEIDAAMASLGLEQQPAKRRGRPRGSKKKVMKKAARRRGTFKVSGEQSVLEFVGKTKNPPNAKEINQYWSKQGRAGKADNAISKLVKTKKLVRVEAKGERGARFKVK